MENVLYVINLAVHNLLFAACAAAPFYQLRMVYKRAKFGKKIYYEMDGLMEEILSQQPRLCFWFIIGLIVTGFAFPVIYYGFHGEFQQRLALVYWALSIKTFLVFVGFGIVNYGTFVIDKQIQEIFKTFKPNEQPPEEVLDKFFALRTKRRKFCTVCLIFAIAILIISPILSFY